MASSSTRKGKSADKSTSWSESKFDENQKQWYTSRRNERGEKEHYWYPPEATSNFQDDPSIPRTFTENEPEVAQIASSQAYYPSPVVSSTSASAYSQVATTSYNISTTDGQSHNTASSYTLGTDPSYTASDPYNPSAVYPFPKSTDADNVSATSGLRQFGLAPTTTTNSPVSAWTSYESPNYGSNPSKYTSVGYGNLETTAQGLASGMGALSLTSRAATQEQGQPGAVNDHQWPTNPKRIYKMPGSGYYEELDPRYQTVSDKNQKRFWTVGRVFMMLWTEPAKVNKVGPYGGTRNGSHFSTTWLNGEAYSEIRRFVVIRSGHGSSICSPIQTYSGQATLKPNLPEQQQHAIIYTVEWPPDEYSYTTEDGTLVRENLSKDPIKVNKEQPDKEGDLGIFSRLNYSKIYTVEHYVRVLKIGMVDQNSLQSLEANSYVRPPTAPAGRPISFPPPANSDKRGSKDKHKTKGKGKPSEHGGGQRRHH